MKLTEEEKQKKYDLCIKFFEKSKTTIRFVAQVIGNIAATFPVVPLGPLFYRPLETDKIVALKWHKRNYDAEIESSNKAGCELVTKPFLQMPVKQAGI